MTRETARALTALGVILFAALSGQWWTLVLVILIMNL